MLETIEEICQRAGDGVSGTAVRMEMIDMKGEKLDKNRKIRQKISFSEHFQLINKHFAKKILPAALVF